MIQPYESVWHYYRDELALLDLKIEALLGLQKQLDPAAANLRGLVLTEEEIEDILQAEEEQTIYSLKPYGEMIRQREQAISASLEATIRQGTFIPLAYLVQVFQLSEVERMTLLICLAVEFDRKYEKLYAYIQDDVTCKYPTLALVMKLSGLPAAEWPYVRSRFAVETTFHRFFLEEENRTEGASLLSRSLKLEERIVRFLLEALQWDERIGKFASLSLPSDGLPPLRIGEDVQAAMRRYVDECYGENKHSSGNLIFHLWGKSGSGKKLQARQFCRHYQQPLLIVDLRKLLRGESSFEALLDTVLRESMLQQAVLCFEHIGSLLGEDPAAAKRLDRFVELVQSLSGILFLLSEEEWKPENSLGPGFIFIPIPLAVPDSVQRREVWEHAIGEHELEEGLDPGALSGKFKLTCGQIGSALRLARQLADWRGSRRIGADELHQACYSQISHRLEEKARKIRSSRTFDDLVLPAEQKELLRLACNQMKYRHLVYGTWGFDRKLPYGKGLSLLFAGPPGTGKTMSAEVIAGELQLEIYKIDLSQMVSKYIGETEKNLSEVFKEAEFSNAILFFDEADALFGKRSEVKDAHDKYANMETSYLLQKMEEYEGITIMATNYSQNIDEAFLRRLTFVVKYPFPDAEQRESIWRLTFPREAPRDADIDFAYLGRKLEIAGGNIKNIVSAAAFLAADEGAAIGMRHLLRATRYELKKSGKILLKEDLGEYADYL